MRHNFRLLNNICAAMCLVCALVLGLSSPIAAASINNPVDAVIEVNCLPTDIEEGLIYEIIIEVLDIDAPVPESSILHIRDDGTGYFNLRITEPGTFHYRIYENAGDNTEVKYDDTIYYVTLFVTQDDNGDLGYAVTTAVNEQGDKPESVSFISTLAAAKPRPVTDTPIPRIEPDTTGRILTASTGEKVGTAFILGMTFIGGGVIVLLSRAKMKGREDA